MTEATITIPFELYNELIVKATAFDLAIEMTQDESMEYKISDFFKFLGRRQEANDL